MAFIFVEPDVVFTKEEADKLSHKWQNMSREATDKCLREKLLSIAERIIDDKERKKFLKDYNEWLEASRTSSTAK